MKKRYHSFSPKQKQPILLNYNRKTAFRAAISLGFIISLIMLLSSILFIVFDKSSNITPLDFISFKTLVGLSFNTLLLYYLFWIQFRIIAKHSQKKVNALLLLISSFFAVAILSPIFSHLQWKWFFSDSPDKLFFTAHFIKDLIILLLSFLYTIVIYLFNQNQEKFIDNQNLVIENQNLVIENLKNRYNALKNQVDPHFLFNSLNTLNGLIGFDDNRAHEYVAQLSRVFRYTMQDQNIISLNDELEFVKSYIYLMKLRYNEALHIHFKIDPRFRKFQIVHFGLQVLVENAIKHNVITRKDPLSIIIETFDNNTIRVENNIQLKRKKTRGNGLALANLNERYRLMFNKEIAIKPNQTKFIVEIPLIAPTEN